MATRPPEPTSLPDHLGTQPDGSWTHVDNGVRLDLTPEQNAAADQFIARSRAADPAITARMHDVVGATGSGASRGYPDFVLKSDDSLKRKMFEDLTNYPGLSPDDLLDLKVKDAVRYTIEVPDGNYVDGVRTSVDALQRDGFENVTFKPSWDDPSGYKGINSTWRDVRTGQIFEVQFHTPESFAAKMETHPLYEAQRVTRDEAEIAARKAAQGEIFGRVPVPDGAPEELGLLAKEMGKSR